MAANLPRTAIAAPSFPLFVAVYAGWITAFVISVVTPVITGSGSMKTSVLFFLLAPATVLVTARWVGASSGIAMLLRRAVAVHALSPILPCVLLGIAQSSDPGAGGHGGLGFLLVFFAPLCVLVASVLGLIGAFTAFGVMRLLRTPEARDGEPGAGAPRS
jgi:hypothetical protein